MLPIFSHAKIPKTMKAVLIFLVIVIGLLTVQVMAQELQRTTNRAVVNIRVPGEIARQFETILIKPEHVDMDVGDVVIFAATGTTAGGVLVNLTEQLTWISSDETLFLIVGGVGTALGPGMIVVDGHLSP